MPDKAITSLVNTPEAQRLLARISAALGARDGFPDNTTFCSYDASSLTRISHLMNRLPSASGEE